MHRTNTMECLTLTAFTGLKDDNLVHLGKLRSLNELTIQARVYP